MWEIGFVTQSKNVQELCTLFIKNLVCIGEMFKEKSALVCEQAGQCPM